MSEMLRSDEEVDVRFFAGEFNQIKKPVTIITGQGALVRGTVLGKITKGAASKAAKTGGNTGNGTLVLDETSPILAGAQPGVYPVRITRAAIAAIGETSPAMKAIAELKDPAGNSLGSFDVPTSSGVAVANQVKFVLTEGNTAFVLGDGFDITITAGSGLFKAYDKDNLDGSEKARLILGEDVDATSEAKASAYAAGLFNEAALTGLDAKAKEDFEGTPIFFGSVV